MKKRKVPSPFQAFLRQPQALWGLLGLAAWTLQQWLHSQKGESFSLPLYAKGALLILGASYLFHLWQAKGFRFLGMFPLLWLALSRPQWEICSPASQPCWNWLVLFLASEILLLSVADGRKLLLLLAPFWALQTHLFRFSLPLALTFLRFPEGWLSPWTRFKAWLTKEEHLRIGHWGKGKRAVVLWLGWVLAWALVFFIGLSLAWFVPVTLFPLAFLASPTVAPKARTWVGWGGVVVALGLFLGYRAWAEISFDWIRTWNFFAEEGNLVFLLLGWLGLASLPSKGNFRSSVFTLFLLVLGFQFWPPSQGFGGRETSLLLWVLVLFAGIGWESFRVNLMDDSWHGRLVWLVLGGCLLAGLL